MKKKKDIVRDEKGISLIGRKRRGIFSLLFSPMGAILVLIVLWLALIMLIMSTFADFLFHGVVMAALFQIFMVVFILNSREDPTAKITWILLIAVLPVLGACFYFYIRIDFGGRRMKKRANQLVKENLDAIPKDPEVYHAIRDQDPGVAQIVKYLGNTGCHPAYDRTATRYYPLGEQKWKDLLEDLRRAKEFIFMEYFIIEEGLMWGKLLEVLEERAKAGVDVRVIYDGTCELVLLPRDYPERLAQLGIKGKTFARLMPLFSAAYNYRNHRKIAVIDGKVGYTGGVNLADEYINEKDVFGHWKDTAVRLEGPAVDTLTLLFQEDWLLDTEEKVDRSFLGRALPQKAPGYVIPMGENPMDEERCAENMYIDFLNRANRYVHIMTPYLILDGELENALRFAAQRGVDVSLILPGIPDKKAIYDLAWTYFPSLMDAGVKIYTYTPGFVHAKVFVSDDEKAFVGTINLDYRSLYHHFECGTYLYKTDSVDAVERDFQKTLAKCELVTPERMEKFSVFKKIVGSVTRVLAPLL